MILAHKIALDPNNAQATYFVRACGVARFAYNWALVEWGRQYEAWKADNTLPKPQTIPTTAGGNVSRMSEILGVPAPTSISC
ncbi:hypothetical protein JCM13664_21840 [Methylothermus subterraneus]